MKTSLKLLGTRIDRIDKQQLHCEIVRYVRNAEHALVLNVNVLCLNLCYEQPELQRFLNSAEIVFCDGFGVQLGAWLKGHKHPPRITYGDWLWDLAALCAREGMSLFFLGARPGVAREAAAVLTQKLPNLKIAGVHHGYFDKTPGSRDNSEVVAKINEAQPDILLVAFGMPLQEYWLRDNWAAVDAHVALTGGAAFDYISGRLNRPPRWMRNNGLEWLGRLVIEPRRLWRRYLIGNPQYLWRLFMS